MGARNNKKQAIPVRTPDGNGSGRASDGPLRGAAHAATIIILLRSFCIRLAHALTLLVLEGAVANFRARRLVERLLREKAFWCTFDGCRKRNIMYGSADRCIPSTERITMADPIHANAGDQMTTLWEA